MLANFWPMYILALLDWPFTVLSCWLFWFWTKEKVTCILFCMKWLEYQKVVSSQTITVALLLEAATNVWTIKRSASLFAWCTSNLASCTEEQNKFLFVSHRFFSSFCKINSNPNTWWFVSSLPVQHTIKQLYISVVLFLHHSKLCPSE